MISDNKYLTLVVMRSACNLIATYENKLSDEAIKTRMLQISGDLVYAVNHCNGDK